MVRGRIKEVYPVRGDGTALYVDDWGGAVAMPADVTVAGQTFRLSGFDYPSTGENIAAATVGDPPREMVLHVEGLDANSASGWIGEDVLVCTRADQAAAQESENMDIELLKVRYPNAAAFKFGDNRALCDDLLRLVRDGHKTATCGALRVYEADGEVMPEPGRRDIGLDWDGRPALVIETIEVTLRRFCDVSESFALAEGEDETLEGWRAGHRRYFERNGGWDAEMMLVCERFRVVEVL